MSVHPHDNEPIGPQTAERVARLCDRFEEDLQRGERPAITTLLGELPARERAAAFRALLAVELGYREDVGQPRTPEEYLRLYAEYADAVRDALGLGPAPAVAVTATAGPAVVPATRDEPPTTAPSRNFRRMAWFALGLLAAVAAGAALVWLLRA
jgi:hypothetical protein